MHHVVRGEHLEIVLHGEGGAAIDVIDRPPGPQRRDHQDDDGAEKQQEDGGEDQHQERHAAAGRERIRYAAPRAWLDRCACGGHREMFVSRSIVRYMSQATTRMMSAPMIAAAEPRPKSRFRKVST